MKTTTMTRYILIILAMLAMLPVRAQQLVISEDNRKTEAPAGAVAACYGKSKGILLPSLTESQRTRLKVGPSTLGLMVYQNDGNSGLYIYRSTGWIRIKATVDSSVRIAKVAMTGSWNDLTDRPSIQQQPTEDLHRVAYSGSWNDLVDRPDIPEGISGLSAFALSGDYHDLSVKAPLPRKVSDLKEDEFSQSVTDADIRRWDSAASLNVPTTLRDLEQDSLHRLVSDIQTERWNTASNRTIPTSLSDLSDDAYYRTVSQENIRTWNTASDRRLNYRLADVPQNMEAQSVTDADIRRWDSAAARTIPTRLRDLAQDSLHMTVSDIEINRWDNHKEKLKFSGSYNDLANTPEIPIHISQFEQDELNRTISYTQRESWNNAAARHIPTRLTDLTDDNMDVRLITARQKALFDTMAARPVPDYTEEKDRFIVTGDPSEMKGYRPLSDFAASANWSDLEGRPTFSKAAQSGSYNDLTVKPALATDFLDDPRYSRLTNTPELAEVATSGTFASIPGAPTQLSDFPADSCVHITQTQLSQYNTMTSTFRNGIAPSEYTSVSGNIENLTLSDNVTLEGCPTAPDVESLDVEEVYSTTRYDNLPVTVGLSRRLNERMMQDARAQAAAQVPDGIIIMMPPGINFNNPCWTPVTGDYTGYFPVGIDNSLYTAPGQTGGAAEVILEERHLPRHSHSIQGRQNSLQVVTADDVTLYNAQMDKNSGGQNYDGNEGWSTARNVIGPSQQNPTVSHNNLPPFHNLRLYRYTPSAEKCRNK